MPKVTRQEVYAAIDSERNHQDSFWPQDGQQGSPNPLTIGEFILLMEEYVAKARAIWTTTKEPDGAPLILDVVRKATGIGVNCMEQHGAPKRGDVV